MSITSESADLDFTLEDGTAGGFSEGYSFAYTAIDSIFKDLESSGVEARGIQFKLEWSAINDVEILSQSYKYLTKPNYH